ncbi:MAG: zf-HC2 domain-containing protein [Thermoanaerobaculia bacterium]
MTLICDEVKRVAYFYLDGQLGRNKTDDFASHLKACGDCDGRIVIHQRLRRLVQHRLARSIAPTPLKDRVRQICRSGGLARPS